MAMFLRLARTSPIIVLMSVTSHKRLSADALLARRAELGRCELIRGELLPKSPAGYDHGVITMRIARLIADFADAHELGVVMSAETGFLLERDPDTVREADVPFIRAERVPVSPMPGFFEGAPDLVVEVLSPTDRATAVAEKVDQWLAGGARLVWVVDSQGRTVTVHRDASNQVVMRQSDVLDGADVLPGFEMRVGELLG